MCLGVDVYYYSFAEMGGQPTWGGDRRCVATDMGCGNRRGVATDMWWQPTWEGDRHGFDMD